MPIVTDTATNIAIDAPSTDDLVGTEALIEADLMIEDISIDGMCGVY
jgi:mycofactocin precursor